MYYQPKQIYTFKKFYKNRQKKLKIKDWCAIYQIKPIRKTKQNPDLKDRHTLKHVLAKH